VLLVVVDQAGIRRRRDHAVVRPTELELAGVAVQHHGRPPPIAHLCERLDP
jgi:hypothetical protein